MSVLSVGSETKERNASAKINDYGVDGELRGITAEQARRRNSTHLTF